MLDQLRRLLEGCEPSPWAYRVVGTQPLICSINRDTTYSKPTVAISVPLASAELICALRNNAEKLIAVCEAAKEFQLSFSGHYHGFPGKLDWPEIHVLRQALEALSATEEGK